MPFHYPMSLGLQLSHLLNINTCLPNNSHRLKDYNTTVRKNTWRVHFSCKQTLWKSLLRLARLSSVLLVRCVEGARVCQRLQTPPVRPPFVPRLAGVLPLLLLCVWTGQQGQHGEGKEGRLCPARPPGRPEGKGAWRVVEQRKLGQWEKEKFSFPFFSLSLSFSPRPSVQSSAPSFLIFLAFTLRSSHLRPGCLTVVSYFARGLLEPRSDGSLLKELKK